MTDTIEDRDIAWARGRTDELGDLMRTRGQIGAEVPVGPETSGTERLVPFLGRRP